MGVILAAILYLAPHLTPAEAGLYARLVNYEAEQAGIPPLLVVTFGQLESGWNYQAKGPTDDYGVLQIRVSKTNYPKLLKHEYLLHDPVLNIHLWMRLAVYWRDHHYAKCYRRNDHPWWSHIGWGHKVRDGGKSGRKREKLYLKLLERFRRVPDT